MRQRNQLEHFSPATGQPASLPRQSDVRRSSEATRQAEQWAPCKQLEQPHWRAAQSSRRGGSPCLQPALIGEQDRTGPIPQLPQLVVIGGGVEYCFICRLETYWRRYRINSWRKKFGHSNGKRHQRAAPSLCICQGFVLHLGM